MFRSWSGNGRFLCVAGGGLTGGYIGSKGGEFFSEFIVEHLIED